MAVHHGDWKFIRTFHYGKNGKHQYRCVMTLEKTITLLEIIRNVLRRWIVGLLGGGLNPKFDLILQRLVCKRVD